VTNASFVEAFLRPGRIIPYMLEEDIPEGWNSTEKAYKDGAMSLIINPDGNEHAVGSLYISDGES